MKRASFPSRNRTDSRLLSGHPKLGQRPLWPFCELCFPLLSTRIISRELGPGDEILAPLTEILEGVLQADRQLMEKTKAKVFSAFITVLQMKEMRGEGQRRYSSGLPSPLAARPLWHRARGSSCGGCIFSLGTLVFGNIIFLLRLFLLPSHGTDNSPSGTILYPRYLPGKKALVFGERWHVSVTVFFPVALQ